MILTIILILAGIYAVITGVPVMLDPRTVIDQVYAAVHIIGGLSIIGIGFAINQLTHIRTSLKKGEKADKPAPPKK